jgi:hypothetical protein
VNRPEMCHARSGDPAVWLAFKDRGELELKGVPDRWRLFGVAS